MGVRDEFAEWLQDELISPITVYAYPPDNPDIPAVVFAPADPYMAVKSFGRSGVPDRISVFLDVTIAVVRTDIEAAFNLLEQTKSEIFTAMGSFVGTDGATAQGGELGRIGTSKAADVDILSGTLDVMIVTAGP